MAATLIKSSGTTLITTIVITAIGFITSVITARVLGPEGRGLLSGALLIATLAGNVALFGLANSYIYHKGTGRPFRYGLYFVVSLLFVAGFSMVLGLMGMQITKEDQLHDQVLLILLLTAVTATQGYFYALSQLHHGLRFFNLMRFMLVIGNLILILVLLLFYKPVDFKMIIITQTIVSAALTVAGIIWARNNRIWDGSDASKPPVAWKSMLGYGASHHGTVVIGLLLVNFDKVALLNIGTIIEYGFYALAFTTSRLIGALQEAVSTALYSRHAGRDVHELSENVRTAFRMTFVPMLGVAAIGALVSPWFIVFVYGESFASTVIPFAVLLFECVISGASWTLAQRFNAGGRPGLVFVRQFISVLPIFIALPFLPKENIHVYLSLLMLAGGILRLSVTLVIYPTVLKERVPDLLPTAADCKAVFNFLARRQVADGKA
jgi:antigen flippase